MSPGYRNSHVTQEPELDTCDKAQFPAFQAFAEQRIRHRDRRVRPHLQPGIKGGSPRLPIAKVVHVDLTGMDPAVRQVFEATVRAFAMQMEFNKRFDVRQKRLEEAIESMTERTGRTEEELAALKARLRRLEMPGEDKET